MKDLSFRHIQSLAIPAIISGITEPILSATDAAVVGNIPVNATEALAMHASNVMLYSTDKKVASRVELITEKDGSKKRRLKKTGEVID